MARAASVDVRFLTVGTESGQPGFTNRIQLEFQKPFVDVQRLCWLLVKKEKRALPVSPGSLAEAGGNLISEDSHMLRLLFGFCGWFGVLLSPASTAPNCQTSPNQLTKSSESGDHGLTSPPRQRAWLNSTPHLSISPEFSTWTFFLVHPSSTLILMWYFAFF